jgi:transcriptional regulator with XRE-family HTH domain
MTNRYKAARLAAGMTQEHLAAAAVVSVSTVRRMETGHRTGPESRRSVAAVLGLDVTDDMEAATVAGSPPQPHQVVYRRRYGVHVVRRGDFRSISMAYGAWVLCAVVSLAGLLATGTAGWSGLAIWHGAGTGLLALFALFFRQDMLRIPLPAFTMSLMAVMVPLASLFLLKAGFDPVVAAVVLTDLGIVAALYRASTKRIIYVDENTPRLGGSGRGLSPVA